MKIFNKYEHSTVYVNFAVKTNTCEGNSYALIIMLIMQAVGFA